MIVIGAKSFAKELLDVLISPKYQYTSTDLFFFDDISFPKENMLFSKYYIFHNEESVVNHFSENTREFCIGIGNPKLRKEIAKRFCKLGGELVTIIDANASIGKFDTVIGKGVTIVGNSIITNSVRIGEGCLIYMNTSITHDVVLGKYVEISPGVSIAGRCVIGDCTSIGIGASVIPDVSIGNNCIIGAGAVVTKNIPSYSIVVGIPGRIIKTVN